ncbi:MAG: O-antigen ligase family protein [Cetobacterium sp.]|uniref:O-antigen ligase family protein n=1 Tax=Cetobacterium sp. TaxID=2071632 RepID=UPI002FC60B94
MILNRERFEKIEEIVLYILGLFMFLDYKLLKNLVPVVIVLLILRKVLFKEKLVCGNEKIKKFILMYIIVGVFWNFLGGMSYKPARNFLKISRYIPFLFFIYPIIERKKDLLKKFLFCSLISYTFLMYKVITQYIKNPFQRVEGIDGISTTGNIGAMVACFAFGLALEEKKVWKKLVYILIYGSGIFITVATQGRAPLLSIVVSTLIMVGLEIYANFDLKKIVISLSLVFLLGIVGLKYIPDSHLGRFKTTFETEKTVDNSSNGLRIEMWKIGILRIKENPVFGSGTKFDKDNFFRKLVEKLPENTEIDKYYKTHLLNSGYNDAHNMYINTTVDNGLFTVVLVIFWFMIPGYLSLKYLKKLKEKRYLIASIGGIASFLTIGAFWMLWRTPEQAYFWILLLILLISIYQKEEIIEKI